jgi:hypothetical protein
MALAASPNNEIDGAPGDVGPEWRRESDNE